MASVRSLEDRTGHLLRVMRYAFETGACTPPLNLAARLGWYIASAGWSEETAPDAKVTAVLAAAMSRGHSIDHPCDGRTVNGVLELGHRPTTNAGRRRLFRILLPVWPVHLPRPRVCEGGP
jgi:hypothetical protein